MAVTKAELMKALGVLKELADADYANRFVAKDGAKVLSTNDFTDALKEKLDSFVDEEVTRADIESIFTGGASGTGQ